MTKHTPGPWGIIKGDAGPIIFSGDKGVMVAQAIRRVTTDERDANARLIAAAPDLLEALNRILDVPKNTMSDGKALKEIVRIARAATAKATGEQK